MHLAKYYESLGMDRVLCTLCPHHCRLATGQRGKCGVRYSAGGKLFALSYGRMAAFAQDPIEKKPLFHYYPGRSILSVGSVGCNFDCDYCQNHHLVQGDLPARVLSPDMLTEKALQVEGNLGVAFTYNEPLIAYEYLEEVAPLLKRAGLKTVVVTNGFIAPDPLASLLDHMDAVNVDLKGFSDAFYQTICSGRLSPVLATIDRLIDSPVPVEISILLIDGLNTSDDELEKMCDWIAVRDPNVPVHLNRYYPAYRLTQPPTEVATLERAAQIARKRLQYVYVGNLLAADRNSTCPVCGEVVLERRGYQTQSHLVEGRCGHCGEDLSAIFVGLDKKTN